LTVTSIYSKKTAKVALTSFSLPVPRSSLLFPICLFAASFLVASSLSSCQPREPGKYVNRKNEFAITFPKNWEIKEEELGLSVIALSPLEFSGDDFRENVSVAASEMTRPLTADDVLDANIPSMINMVTEFKPDTRGHQKIGDKDAAWLTYSQRQGRKTLATTLYAVPGRTHAYLIYCTAETEAAPRFKDAFEKTIASFKVLE